MRGTEPVNGLARVVDRGRVQREVCQEVVGRFGRGQKARRRRKACKTAAEAALSKNTAQFCEQCGDNVARIRAIRAKSAQPSPNTAPLLDPADRKRKLVGAPPTGPGCGPAPMASGAGEAAVQGVSGRLTGRREVSRELPMALERLQCKVAPARRGAGA